MTRREKHEWWTMTMERLMQECGNVTWVEFGDWMGIPKETIKAWKYSKSSPPYWVGMMLKTILLEHWEDMTNGQI